jgi:hypothetical protein
LGTPGVLHAVLLKVDDTACDEGDRPPVERAMIRAASGLRM